MSEINERGKSTLTVVELPTVEVPIPSVIALGFFDGCHTGHRTLLRETVRRARAMHLESAVFTFSDEGIKAGALRIYSLEDRLETFRRMGIEKVYLASFESLRNLSPEWFVKTVLVEMCGAKWAVSGPDFRFGKNAAGGPDTLAALMRRQGSGTTVLPPVLDRGEKVSSTSIRRALESGDMERAGRMLGEAYHLTLPVLHGKGLGHTLGFPTANQAPAHGRLLPGRGVYRTETEVDGAVYPSLTNVGLRPTVEKADGVNVETHLIGYRGDLYGKTVTVRFLQFLRPERRFDSVDALKAQLEEDVRRVLAKSAREEKAEDKKEN